MPEIMIAVRPGTVYLPGIGRRMVRKGKTTAHAGHPIVTQHPRLWAPLKVDYPVEPERSATAVPAKPSPATEVDNAAVRAWAAGQGIEVSPRGKIPQHVVDQYLAAQES